MNKIDYQKLRGGFYTPEDIATFLCDWAISSKGLRILEPSCGDGIFVEAACKKNKSIGTDKPRITAIEIDPNEANKTRKRISNLDIDTGNISIENGDFFSFCQQTLIGDQVNRSLFKPKEQFDVILGNPPFIRYQDFPPDSRKIAFSIMNQIGLKPTRLSNIWLPFLTISVSLLSKNGRLAMIIPASLFQVNYAAEARKYLSESLSTLNIIAFEKLAFENVQEEVVLLLGQKNDSHEHGIRIFSLTSKDDLSSFKANDISRTVPKELNHTREKWTRYYLSNKEIDLLKEVRSDPNVTSTKDLFDVNVGIVTGRNEFFILNNEQVIEYKLGPYLDRIVSRSGHLHGIEFTEKDWKTNKENNIRVYLFTPPDVPFEDLPIELQDYVIRGESKDYHTGYKCRIRDPWYIVPSQWKPDAFFLRQVHDYPKLILNNGNASCTDTIHRVKFHKDIDRERIALSFLNSLTFASSEVIGRSYGGGVLTFEPSEALLFSIPLLNTNKLDRKKIDSLERENRIDEILKINDDILLKQGLGLSTKDISMLRGIWEKLRDRRINRKRK